MGIANSPTTTSVPLRGVPLASVLYKLRFVRVRSHFASVHVARYGRRNKACGTHRRYLTLQLQVAARAILHGPEQR